MAFWGIELAESDEFCTPYDDFVDLFEIGEEPANIGAILLERYRNRYGSDEGIPSNVIFALAKAQWMFCAQSQEILDRVHEMIKNGTDIEYYRSLGFSEEDLTARRLALQKFWQSLQTPKTTVRKRRISPHNRIKRLPKGTVAWYEYKGDYFGFVVLDAVYTGRLLALTKALPAEPQTAEEVLSAPALTVIWWNLITAPKGHHTIGQIESKGDFNGRGGCFLCKAIGFGHNTTSYMDECHRRAYFEFPGKVIRDLLSPEAIPIEFMAESTREQDKRMVLELMENPASPYARERIYNALHIDWFFH